MIIITFLAAIVLLATAAYFLAGSASLWLVALGALCALIAFCLFLLVALRAVMCLLRLRSGWTSRGK